MSVSKKQTNELTKDLTYMEQQRYSIPLQMLPGLNEMPVDLLDPVLIRWIKVIKPSRASLTRERFE